MENEFIYPSYPVSQLSDLWEKVNWCEKTYDLGKYYWDYVTMRFVFKTEEDRMLFLLRWLQ